MSEQFPFSIDDIQAWWIRRKDGTVVRYNLITAEQAAGKTASANKPVKSSVGSWTSYGRICAHTPHPATMAPVFKQDDIGLWIADSAGARNSWTEFDVAIDGGGVLTVPGEHDLPNLFGDPSLRAKLAKHVIQTGSGYVTNVATRIIKLRWFDREAPPVYPSFWPALLDELRSLQAKIAVLHPEDPVLRVLTICQGGHGRSGTALASLMMCLSDYTPLDALIHIRAVHCARAIESKVQHEYLNSLAAELGRSENALDAEKISSFREAFLKSTSEFATPYQEKVRSGGGATVTDRKDDPFCAM